MKKKLQKEPSVNPEIELLKGQLARTLADYDNLLKRTQEEKFTWIKFATGNLVQSLLPILDNLDRTLKSNVSEEQSSWFQSIKMTDLSLRKILADNGLKEISTDKFDPNFHDAIEIKDGPKDEILEVLETGYTLNGKLIRPAKVVVGNGS
jgi:molecular chaperone GrpE